MKNLKRYASQVISILVLVAAFALALFVRFSHPEMTETQLLLNYPLFWVAVVALALLGGFLFPK